MGTMNRTDWTCGKKRNLKKEVVPSANINRLRRVLSNTVTSRRLPWIATKGTIRNKIDKKKIITDGFFIRYFCKENFLMNTFKVDKEEFNINSNQM